MRDDAGGYDFSELSVIARKYARNRFRAQRRHRANIGGIESDQRHAASEKMRNKGAWAMFCEMHDHRSKHMFRRQSEPSIDKIRQRKACQDPDAPRQVEHDFESIVVGPRIYWSMAIDWLPARLSGNRIMAWGEAV